MPKVNERSILNRNYGEIVKSPFSEQTEEWHKEHLIKKGDQVVDEMSLMCSGGFVDENNKKWVYNPFDETYHSFEHTAEDEKEAIRIVKEMEKKMGDVKYV